jgi:hypothetical protein
VAVNLHPHVVSADGIASRRSANRKHAQDYTWEAAAKGAVACASQRGPGRRLPGSSLGCVRLGEEASELVAPLPWHGRRQPHLVETDAGQAAHGQAGDDAWERRKQLAENPCPVEFELLVERARVQVDACTAATPAAP